MLIQFRVENHRSLRDEQVLSMVATDRDPDDPRLLHPDGLENALLPSVAVYGANASGKTNVLLALGFMARAVLDSHRFWEPELGAPQEAFALSDKGAEPSLYETDLIAKGTRYRYGFVLSANRVEEEWLHAFPNGHEQTWFTREGDRFDFGPGLEGENETIRKLTRENSLFLSAAAQNNHAALLPVFAWFARARIRLSATGARPFTLAMALDRILRREATAKQASLFPEDVTDRARIVHLLQAADTGIIDLRVDDPDGIETEEPQARRRRLTLSFRHRAEGEQPRWLPLEVQSQGTVTLLDIAVQLVEVLRRGGLLCVDELECSLHPALALELLRMFHDPKSNPRGAQLVFTTHDTNLLGNVLGDPPLRRDQVWFTEKDASGATHLYPLTDFHPRKEENLERGYLQGRYGAVPFLGELLLAPREPEDR